MFDKPVEEATEWLFYNAFKAVGGEKAVGERKPGHGTTHEQQDISEVPGGRAETKKEL